MKKIILTLMLLFVFAGVANAAWTIVPSKVGMAEHYIFWQVLLTADNDALPATDILLNDSALTTANMPARLLKEIQGETLMKMLVIPGEGGVIPDGTINITFTNEKGASLWADTGISKDGVTWHTMSKDLGIFIPISGVLKLAINDCVTAGDQITLYFITWIEER